MWPGKIKAMEVWNKEKRSNWNNCKTLNSINTKGKMSLRTCSYWTMRRWFHMRSPNSPVLCNHKCQRKSNVFQGGGMWGGKNSCRGNGPPNTWISHQNLDGLQTYRPNRVSHENGTCEGVHVPGYVTLWVQHGKIGLGQWSHCTATASPWKSV